MGKWIEANFGGREAGLFQAGAGLQEMFDTAEKGPFAIGLGGFLAAAIFGLACNGVGKGMFFAERFDLGGVEIVQVVE